MSAYLKINLEDDSYGDVSGSRLSRGSGSDIKLDNRSLLSGYLESNPNEAEKEATMFSCVVNLTNSIIGSGVLGLPYAFAASGWTLGFTFLILAAAATIFSLHLLAQCNTRVQYPSSFYRVTEASIPKCTFLVDLSVATQCFGVSLSYLIVIGGLMTDVMEAFGATGPLLKRQVWILIGFCIVAPLSSLSNIDALKYTSALAIVFVFFIAALVLSYAVDPALDPCEGSDHASCPGTTSLALFDLDTVKRLGVFVFAFSCQMNIFPVSNELIEPTQSRVNLVIYSAIFISAGLYGVVAASGYSMYGIEVSSNILQDFPNTTLVSVARLLVCLLVSFSYPILCNPGRKSWLSLWAMMDTDPLLAEQHATFRYVTVTVIYLFGTLGLAMVLTDLGVILAIVGATGSTVVTFILPGAAYRVLFPGGPGWKRAGALGLLVFGCIFMPVCLVTLFL